LEGVGEVGKGGGVSGEWVVKVCGIDQRPAEMLLTGCAALGLLRKQGARYQNTPLSDTYLVPGKPYCLNGFFAMLDKRLYPAWGRLLEAVRHNRPTSWDPATQRNIFAGQDPLMLAHCCESMQS